MLTSVVHLPDARSASLAALHPEPQRGTGGADLIDADPLQVDPSGVLEEPPAAAEQHRHDVHPQLVDEARGQQLPVEVGPADDQDGPVAGRLGRL